MRENPPSKSIPLYQAAKFDDADAAAQLVKDTINNDQIETLRSMIDDRSPVLVSVHAYEATGINAIPEAFADKFHLSKPPALPGDS